MSALLRMNHHSNLALEIARGERSVAYVALTDTTRGIALLKQDKREFDHEFYREPAEHAAGVAPTPRNYARHMLTQKHFSVESDAVAALVSALAMERDEPRPRDVALLIKADGEFLGAYESPRDAQLAATALGYGYVVAKPSALSDEALMRLKQVLAPDCKIRAGAKLREELFRMATKADKPATAAPKVDKTQRERKERKDGPIAKVKEYVAKNADKLSSGALTVAQARAALLETGINKTTVTVQIARWLKEFKISAQKGGRVVKNDDGKFEVAKPKNPKPAKTPKVAAPAAPKKATAKKSAAPKAKKAAKPAKSATATASA